MLSCLQGPVGCLCQALCNTTWMFRLVQHDAQYRCIQNQALKTDQSYLWITSHLSLKFRKEDIQQLLPYTDAYIHYSTIQISCKVSGMRKSQELHNRWDMVKSYLFQKYSGNNFGDRNPPNCSDSKHDSTWISWERLGKKAKSPFPTSRQIILSEDCDVEDHEVRRLDLTNTLYGVCNNLWSMCIGVGLSKAEWKKTQLRISLHFGRHGSVQKKPSKAVHTSCYGHAYSHFTYIADSSWQLLIYMNTSAYTVNV